MGTGIGVGIAGQVYDLKPGGSTPPPSYSNLYSMEFTGASNQWLNNTSSPLLGTAGTGAWSISFWFNFSTVAGGSQRILDINPGGSGARFQIYLDPATPSIRVAGDFTDNFNSFPISAGVWYHCIYRYTGTSGAGNNVGYVMDGTNIDSGTKTVNPFATTGNFLVGRNQAASGGYMTGYLDELSIWDKYLSDAEAIEVYNSGTPTDLAASSMAANLQHWWRMGDPTGTSSYPTIIDAQGSLDLTMNNQIAGDIQTNVP